NGIFTKFSVNFVSARNNAGENEMSVLVGGCYLIQIFSIGVILHRRKLYRSANSGLILNADDAFKRRCGMVDPEFQFSWAGTLYFCSMLKHIFAVERGRVDVPAFR